MAGADPNEPGSSSASPPSGSEPPEDGANLRDRAAALRQRAGETRERATGWVDERRAERSEIGVALDIVADAWERDAHAAGGLLAGGLAFRVFLWLLPAALVAVSVFGYAADYVGEDPAQVAQSVGFGAVVATTVAQGVSASEKGGVWLLLFGLVFLLWASAGLAKAFRVSASLLWQRRPSGWRSTRAALVVLAFLIPLMAEQAMGSFLWSGGVVTDVLAEVINLAWAIAIVTLAFALLPHPAEARWWFHLPGAALIGIGAQGLAIATSIYFAGKLDRVDDLYGSLGTATVILGWLFVVARLTVWGIALNVAIFRRARPDLEEATAGTDIAASPGGAVPGVS